LDIQTREIRQLIYPEKLIVRINRAASIFLRYVRILQLLVGVFLMLLGYCMGKMHFDLIMEGAAEQTIHFKDWMGSSVAAGLFE
jgi:hypothetical protein